MVGVHPNRSKDFVVSIWHFDTSLGQVATVTRLGDYLLAVVVGYGPLAVPIVQVADNVFHFSHLFGRLFPFYLYRLT